MKVMSLYIRAYEDFSYEIIYLDKGIFNTKRLHILINPSKNVKLPGQTSREKDREINVESLTHIISMQTSIKNKDMIKRTIFIAERTNKPIITNEDTATYFKDHGLSVKQLRIIGFEQEVVDGLQLDPIYLEELSDTIIDTNKEEQGLIGFGKKFVKNLNPLSWKPLDTIQSLITRQKTEMEEIDPENPLGYILHLGSKNKLLLPLDKRGISNLNRIIPQLKPNTVVVPNRDIEFTRAIEEGAKNVVILNSNVEDDELLVLPKNYNDPVPHNTYFGALGEWIDLEDL